MVFLFSTQDDPESRPCSRWRVANGLCIELAAIALDSDVSEFLQDLDLGLCT